MNQGVVGFHHGEHLFKIGYPHVITAAGMKSGGEIQASCFVVIYKVPESKYVDLRIRTAMYEAASFRNAGVEPFEFAMEDILGAAKNILWEMQYELYKTTSDDHVLRERTLAPADWKRELLRMRYRGFDEALLDKIANASPVDELSAYLGNIRFCKPIVVRSIS